MILIVERIPESSVEYGFEYFNGVIGDWIVKRNNNHLWYFGCRIATWDLHTSSVMHS